MFRFNLALILSNITENLFYEMIINLKEATFSSPIITIENNKNDTDISYRVLLGSRADIVHCFIVKCLN